LAESEARKVSEACTSNAAFEQMYIVEPACSTHSGRRRNDNDLSASASLQMFCEGDRVEVAAVGLGAYFPAVVVQVSERGTGRADGLYRFDMSSPAASIPAIA
jgi:hypothetical protein